MEWAKLPILDKSKHDNIYIDVLKKHGLSDIKIGVPLTRRYTKGRRWTELEHSQLYECWLNKKSLTYTSALLNRNPQDMIYKLLDYCKRNDLTFTQVDRSEGTVGWNPIKAQCAEELFGLELPAWKIAILFRVDFEFVEKEMYGKRKGYGHNKKNPFGINTDHKQVVNGLVLDAHAENIKDVFEPFAGEGRFTQQLLQICPIARILCYEQELDTAKIFRENISDQRVSLEIGDNIEYFATNQIGSKFDLIDLDPFVSCHQQLESVWSHIKHKSFLFITFGGEYRRSFIRTNRKSIFNRYGFIDNGISNSEYLEIVPNYFLGKVAQLAAHNNFRFDVLRAVRYANNCRFWLQVTHDNNANEWFEKSVESESKGYRFESLNMPRFRELRHELLPQKSLELER